MIYRVKKAFTIKEINVPLERRHFVKYEHGTLTVHNFEGLQIRFAHDNKFIVAKKVFDKYLKYLEKDEG